MTDLVVCSSCGRKFKPWRKKAFCSERCRKREENRRFRASGGDIAGSQISQKIDEQNQEAVGRLRGDESPAFKVAHAKWVFSNEITGKLDYQGRALGWVMYADRPKCWLSRVRDVRGDWSFRAANRKRAEQAVEAWIRYEPIDTIDGEKMWMGDCMAII